MLRKFSAATAVATATATATATTRLFRIQYVSDLPSVPSTQFSSLLKPVAPYLAIVGTRGLSKAFFEWAAPQWQHILCVGPIPPVASNIRNTPYLCAKENVVLLDSDDTEYIDECANWGTQICVVTKKRPQSTPNSAVRLWIHSESAACSHMRVGSTMVLANPYNAPGWCPDVWMEFPTVDPQEAEAAAKRDQTLLRLEPVDEDITS